MPGGRQASAGGGGGEVKLEEQHEADPVGEANVDHEVPPGGGQAAAGQQPAVEHVLEHDDEVPRAHWTKMPGRPGQRQTPEAQVEAKWHAAHAQDRAGAPAQGVGPTAEPSPSATETQTLWSNDGGKGMQPPRSEQSPDPSTDGRSLLETSVSRHKLYGPNNGYKASNRPEVNRAPTRVQRLQPPLDECVVSQLNRSTPGTQAGSRPDVKSSNRKTKIKVHRQSVKSSNDESTNK